MKKIKFLALAVLVVLVLVGGAYAMWTDTITIDGYVETGSIDVQFAAFSYSEAAWHYSMYSDPGPDRTGVMYANLVADYSYSEDVSVSTDGKLWTVKLYNTIPELIVRKFVHVKNDGTAPVVLDEIWLTDGGGTRYQVDPAHALVVDSQELRFSLHDTAGSWTPATLGMELAAGETKEFAISVHTLPTASMNQTLTYKLELVWKLKDPSAP